MRLIDVDELRKTIAGKIVEFETIDDCTVETLRKCKAIIEKQPTIDAVPVVHGRWEDVPQSDVPAYRCSECGRIRYGSRVPPFCPSCGAKMDTHCTHRGAVIHE